MKTCKHCDKAATDWRYGGMNPACPDCVVRELAKSPRHHREAAFDHVMKHRGEAAAHELRRRWNEEYARLRALREERK